MLKIFKQLLACLLMVASIFSCTKDDDQQELPSFDAFVNADTSLTMFGKAVAKANLQDFKTGGPFTWFAPTNSAFAAAGITSDSLDRMTSNRISYFLVYHLVNSRYQSVDMLAISSISRNTQLGQTVFNGSFNNTFFVNGGKIIKVDNKINSGIVHVTDKFLLPPAFAGNIQAILTRTGQHSLLIAALTKANLWATFGTTAAFTIMAPTDAAMNAAGITSAYIAATPAATLAPILRYHYFTSVRLFTNDFASDVNTIATAAGASTFLVTSSEGTRVKGRNNPTPVTITTPNILGTNGVVHIIDGTLLQ